MITFQMPNGEIFNIFGFLDKGFAETTFFKFRLPTTTTSANHTGEEFRISFNYDSVSGNPFIGLISRKPGHFWVGFFELDVVASTLTLK